jgi:hypothetical protein
MPDVKIYGLTYILMILHQSYDRGATLPPPAEISFILDSDHLNVGELLTLCGLLSSLVPHNTTISYRSHTKEHVVCDSLSVGS